MTGTALRLLLTRIQKALSASRQTLGIARGQTNPGGPNQSDKSSPLHQELSIPTHGHFNDSPIEKPEDDRYGLTPFADSIAKSILGIKAPEGTTIALHGPWGSGKSSAVNLIRFALNRAKDSKLVVTEFSGWWYRGDKALTLAFLQHLDSALKKGLGDKVKEFIPKITRRMLQAGSVIGTAASIMGVKPVADITSQASSFASTFFSDHETVEETFKKLALTLSKSDDRFLVIIDDIDRLLPEEALAIFRLVKSVGRLPNVMYLLVFDRKLAEKAVLTRYPSEGPHFLEKIIQAGFELPPPIQTDLNDAVLTSVNEICGFPSEEAEIVYFMNVFYDVVAPHIVTPRHVVRLRNAISVTWPAIANEVNLGDFIALETIRLYEPGLFDAIRLHKSTVCGHSQRDDPAKHDDSRFTKFWHDLPENRRALAKRTLQRLFPRLENISYGAEWIRKWDAERRVCIEAHYDTYFRLSLSDEALSSEQVKELIERAGDRVFIRETLKKAAATKRRGGKSMVPVYLNELTTYAPEIAKRDVADLVSALFEVHDQIDLEQDAESGFMATGNTSLRLSWLIRRLTKDRFTLEERASLYLAAIKKASLGWLVDFVSMATRDYDKDGHRVPTRDEEDCLVTNAALGALTTDALRCIRAAAEDGSLLHHPDLGYILYRWRDFLGDSCEVRSWTDSLLTDDSAVVILARALISRSWSAGMGGFGSLGDRIATPSTVVQISDEIDIMDLGVFRSALERVLHEAKVEPKDLADVRAFLEAWDRRPGKKK